VVREQFTRTVRPATGGDEPHEGNAGARSRPQQRIAFHQIPHANSGSPRSGMVASMVQVGSGHPIGTNRFTIR